MRGLFNRNVDFECVKCIVLLDSQLTTESIISLLTNQFVDLDETLVGKAKCHQTMTGRLIIFHMSSKR